MTLPVVFTANGPSGYNLTKSLRFRSSASAYLNRTPASSGSQTTFTWSGWVKRGTLGVRQAIFSSGASNVNGVDIYFTSSDTLTFEEYNGGTNYFNRTSAVYRDPSAWYHIVVAVDSTQATDSNRVKMYVNGSQITAFSTAGYPTQNFAYQINTASYPARISNGTLYASEYLDGYQTEINFVDGQALTPSSFGSTNALTGVWQPAKYTGTYGTNGFYLPFTDVATTSGSNAGLGKDFSGNGNYWNTNNISVTAGSTYDSMTDVPTLTSATTANYCVLNPLAPPPWAGSNYALSNGNLTSTYGYQSAPSTFAMSNSGKWYWEVTCTTNCDSSQNNSRIGIVPVPYGTGTPGDMTGSYAYTANGNKGASSTYTSYGATYTNGDVIGVAFDSGAGTLEFFKNGTSQGTAYTGISGIFYAMNGSGGASGTVSSTNFGQQPFSYTPPTGFVALNTYNLPTSTIVKGNTVMDATLYTGNGTSQNVTNAGFKPDLVWGKNRSNVANHGLVDSVRGVSTWLGSNSTAAENTVADSYVTAFNSNGFTAGLGGVFNASGDSYVGWQWQAGQGTTSSNTSGSITSTVSVNPTAGFSVVTYTGTGSTATIGHGLGIAPSMIIVKRRDAGGSGWSVYFTTLPAGYVLSLQSTNGQANSPGRFTTTLPTSSVFSVGTDSDLNGSGGTYVAYCWSEIAGFSKFTSYTGNGSADGPFVYCGFQPKFVMIKVTSTTSNWFMFDSARNTYNVTNNCLIANGSNAEFTGQDLDLLSNGFKLRSTSSGTNDTSQSYIVMAFASNPFKNSLAR